MAISDGLWFCCFLIFIWLLFTFIVKSIKNCIRFPNKFQYPPSPLVLSIIGHLYLIGSVLAKSLQTLANRHGPLMQLRMGASTCYVISDAAVAKEILKRNELNFISRTQFDSSYRNIYRGSSFITAPYGMYWRFMKKLCMTRLLSTSQLNQYVHIREEEIKKLLESLISISRKGECCDLNPTLMAMTNNVICRMAMSTRCSENANEAREIKDLVDHIVGLKSKLTVGNILGPLAKLDLFGHGKQLRKVLGKFDLMMERIIKEHEERHMMGGTQEVKDLMDILLETSGDSDAEVKLSRKDIKAFFPDIFMTGTETSSVTMEWILAELINHPTVFMKLREEIDLVVGTNRLVKESDVPNLPYMQAVVKKGLRLHPTAPIFIRECIEDCKINGFDLKGKTRMLINIYTIMRDPILLINPNEFISERFMFDSNIYMNPIQREMEIKGQNFSYLPFGSGRRGCPGASLGLMVMHATIGALVQCFDWKVKGVGEKVDMEEGPGLTMGMAHPLVCYPIKCINPL